MSCNFVHTNLSMQDIFRKLDEIEKKVDQLHESPELTENQAIDELEQIIESRDKQIEMYHHFAKRCLNTLNSTGKMTMEDWERASMGLDFVI